MNQVVIAFVLVGARGLLNRAVPHLFFPIACDHMLSYEAKYRLLGSLGAPHILVCDTLEGR